MIKKSIKAIVKLIAAFLTVVTLIASVFAVWVYTGPRQIPFLSDYVSKYVSDLLPADLNLEMSSAEVFLDSELKVSLKFNDLKLIDAQKGQISMDNVYINLDPLAYLPQSHRNLLNIRVSQPSISYRSLVDSGKNEALPLNVINNYLNTNKDVLLKFSLALTNTDFDLDISDEIQAKIRINNFVIKPALLNGKIIFATFGDVTINGQVSTFEATADTQSNKYLTVKGVLKNFSNYSLAGLGLDMNFLERANITLSTNFTALIKSARNIDYVEFDVLGTKGFMDENNVINKPIKLDKITAKGYCSNNCSEIMLEKFAVKTDRLTLEGKAEYKLEGGRQILLADVSSSPLSVQDLDHHWPKTAIPRTRKWLFDHITAGKTSDLKAKFKFYMEELLAKKLDKSDFNVSLDLADTNIYYMDSVPPIEQANGHVIIKPDVIDITLTSGNIYDVKLFEGKSTIYDLTARDSKMAINVKAAGNIQNMIDLAYLHAEKPNATLKGFDGNASAVIDLSFPLTDDDITLSDLNMVVKADAKDVSAKKVYKNIGLTDGSFRIGVKDMKVQADGTALIQSKINAKIIVHENLAADDRRVQITALVDPDKIKLLGFTPPEHVKGEMEAKLELLGVNDFDKGELALNLTRAEIAYPEFGIQKRASEEGVLTAKFSSKPSAVILEEYNLSWPNFQSKGSALFSSDFNLKELHSSHTRLGKGTFALSYEQKNIGTDISITGESFDVSEIKLSTAFENKKGTGLNLTNRKASNTRLLIHLATQKIFMKDGIELKIKPSRVVVDNGHPSNINLSGEFPNRTQLSISLTDGKIAVYSNDAGLSLKALGITSKLSEGVLNISGKLTNASSMQGELKVTDYKLHKTPVLAKMISVVSILSPSLDGFLNLVEGGGMRFDTLTCPYRVHDNVLFLDKCLFNGPSLAITATGSINLSSEILDIKGTVASKGIINTALKNIPLIGTALFNKSEHSIFGANYTMKGSIDDPKVSSNPLSLLAPGALKEAF